MLPPPVSSAWAEAFAQWSCSRAGLLGKPHPGGPTEALLSYCLAFSAGYRAADPTGWPRRWPLEGVADALAQGLGILDERVGQPIAPLFHTFPEWSEAEQRVAVAWFGALVTLFGPIVGTTLPAP